VRKLSHPLQVHDFCRSDRVFAPHEFQHDGDRAALQQRVEVIKQQMRPLLEWGST
jgi:hypothetical protein